MNPSHPPNALWQRFAWIGWALLVLLWIPVEDFSPHAAVLLANLACWLGVAQAETLRALRGLGHRLGKVVFCLVGGGLVGVLTAPAALGLMALKTGLHAHAVSEYTPDQMMWVFISTPLWVIASGLMGLACGLVRSVRR